MTNRVLKGLALVGVVVGGAYLLKEVVPTQTLADPAFLKETMPLLTEMDVIRQKIEGILLTMSDSIDVLQTEVSVLKTKVKADVKGVLSSDDLKSLEARPKILADSLSTMREAQKNLMSDYNSVLAQLKKAKAGKICPVFCKYSTSEERTTAINDFKSDLASLGLELQTLKILIDNLDQKITEIIKNIPSERAKFKNQTEIDNYNEKIENDIKSSEALIINIQRQSDEIELKLKMGLRSGEIHLYDVKTNQ